MAKFVALLAAGISQGSISALIALGLVLLHKATGIVNFAQGDLLTLGAYLGVWLTVTHHIPLLLGYAITVAIVFTVGVGIERVGYAPLRRQPILAVIISTFALALGIRSLMTLWLGAEPRTLPPPLGNDTWEIAGAKVPHQTILIVLVTAVVFVALQLLLQRTAIGRQVRALAADRETALLQGIRVNRLSLIMFGASAALAGLAGLLVAPTLTVDANLGFLLLLSSFAAVVLGGFDNIGGSVAAAFGIAIAEQMLTGYVSPQYKEAYPFIILLVALVIRPSGLFPDRRSVRY